MRNRNKQDIPPVAKTGKPQRSSSEKQPLWKRILNLPVKLWQWLSKYNLNTPIGAGVVFGIILTWAATAEGDMFRVAREYSFWADEDLLMDYMRGKDTSWLLCHGQHLLMYFKNPWVGGTLLSLMLTLGCVCLGYILHLPRKFDALKYIPAGFYVLWISNRGFNNFFETETGELMGYPAAAFIALLALSVVVWAIRRTHPRKLLAGQQQPFSYWLLTPILLLVFVFIGKKIERPEVRIVCHMQTQLWDHDYEGMINTALERPELSYRQIAAYYAIALAQTDQITSKLYDIRLDYDKPDLKGFDENNNNELSYYIQDCDLYAGLVEPAIHHAMEQMTMNGPNIRSLKTLTKCALLRGEWEVARKYLTILSHVPLESEFVEKYRAMLENTDAVNADEEFAHIRLLEPIHDSFENQYIQPVFLGYNAALAEGRSVNALYNSMMVSQYTKTMPDFVMRSQPLQGQSVPKSLAEALALMSGKMPEILQAFPNVKMYTNQVQMFIADTQDYVKDIIDANGDTIMTSAQNRAKHAKELFNKYQGFYPYYYFFGNLKATKKKDNTENSSSQGVN